MQIYDEALANKYTLNWDSEKIRTHRRIEPRASRCPVENFANTPHGITAVKFMQLHFAWSSYRCFDDCKTQTNVSSGIVIFTHRYSSEIPEPAPFLSWYGDQIGGLQVFPVIKIIVAHQVRMSPASTAIWVWRWTHIKHRMTYKDCGCICFVFVFACVISKKRKEPQFEPTWLTMPLHGAVYEVWDLSDISVTSPLIEVPTFQTLPAVILILLFIKCTHFNLNMLWLWFAFSCFISEGNYVITVRAHNFFGNASKTLSSPFYVQIPPVFSLCPDKMCSCNARFANKIGETTNLTVSLERGTNVFYNWSMGDETDYLNHGKGLLAYLIA